MRIYFSWYLLAPVILAALYGAVQCRAVAAMGAAHRPARINWLVTALPAAVLTVGWSALGFPLPLFYVLAYLFRAIRLLGRGPVRRKNCFFLNLSYVNTMALHLALIGAAALARGVTMHALLSTGFWRTSSAAAVLAADVAEGLLFLRRAELPAALAAEAGSEEARPFMAFLWFCTGYLLIDSFLCVIELEPLYPPLFLIGSITILMYFIIRFLLHIHALIRGEYLMREHARLSTRLRAARQSAGTLQRIVDRDALTGALSRRNVMERMDALIGEGRPFCLAFLDLDGLKRINDSQGHEGGDRYLAGFAGAMAAGLGPDDLFARVGGDEFVALLRERDPQRAARSMQAIRSALEAGQEGAAFRFSYGVAAFCPGEACDAEALLQAADRAMYRDKAQRRKEGGAGPC
ncbi:GGDEF domain-containing protein [Allofournierella sp.]|uniref:GGDEF domain-containing protein n=1 Tax=Allofournierella sp. TaxID=1940256 RepID=UPI003AB2B37C